MSLLMSTATSQLCLPTLQGLDIIDGIFQEPSRPIGMTAGICLNSALSCRIAVWFAYVEAFMQVAVPPLCVPARFL